MITNTTHFAHDLFYKFRDYILTYMLYWLVYGAIVYTLWRMTKSNFAVISPKIIKIYKEEILILVEQGDWMGMRTAAAIYFVSDGLERLVCAAVVINVQPNRLVQLEIRKLENDPTTVNDIMQRIEDGKKA